MRLKPFRGIRPRRTYVKEVSSLPYDVYSEAEARAIVDKNPRSFLTVVRPETMFPVGTDSSSQEVYEKARDLIAENIESGDYKFDEKDSYYIYRQEMNGRVQTGLVACFAVDDYLEGNIRKHELTRADKEDDRTRHIDVCSAQTGLVFLTFKEGEEARRAIANAIVEQPLYDFVSEDRVHQRVWKIDDEEQVTAITAAFSKIDCLYIADGHHRSYSAATVCKMRRAELGDKCTGEEEFNYFMAVAFPCEDLLVMPYYRVVSDLNGMSHEEFIERLREKFIVEKKDLLAYEPKHQGEVAMFLDDIWYKLTAKPEILKTDPIGSLDVSMLQDNILAPLLGIVDLKTDKRIDFIGGIRGLAELERRCHSDMRVAFATRHTTIEQLMRVADDGQVMPPKSTWFEPKLQSGLFIHRI